VPQQLLLARAWAIIFLRKACTNWMICGPTIPCTTALMTMPAGAGK